MIADYRVCLDACVLANQGVCDLLFRLAEHPRLYTPIFSEQILDEVRTVHLERLKKPWPEELANFWQSEVRKTFPEAIVSDYKQLIPVLENDEGDRHVLAAAIRGQAELIVTFNLKDFPRQALQPWGIQAAHPQDYLITLYELRPEVVTDKLHAIAADRKKSPEESLDALKRSLPLFAEHISNDIGWELPDSE